MASLTTLFILFLFLSSLAGTFYVIRTIDPFGLFDDVSNTQEKTPIQFSDSESSSSDSDEDQDEEVDVEREFTISTLKPYNGEDMKEIYISLKGQGMYF